MVYRLGLRFSSAERGKSDPSCRRATGIACACMALPHYVGDRGDTSAPLSAKTTVWCEVRALTITMGTSLRLHRDRAERETLWHTPRHGCCTTVCPYPGNRMLACGRVRGVAIVIHLPIATPADTAPKAPAWVQKADR